MEEPYSAAAAANAAAAADGFYCSTSGTYFTDKESLTEHYKSDFHRYNLKRKVAGLPPVTREWFDARKAQLVGASALSASTSSAAAGAPVTRVWTDPLTKKKFGSENTYQAHVKSKKYRELMRKEGVAEPPAPIVTIRRQQEEGNGGVAPPRTAGMAVAAAGAGGGFTVKPAVKGGEAAAVREVGGARDHMSDMEEGADEEGDGGSSSGWETASDVEEDVGEEMEAEKQGEWEEWDVCRSLFDGQVSQSFEANLEHMWRNYGFYLPDAEYLADPQGLLQYLGHKLQYGRVPLYSRGDDASSRQFRSLHAVQRHMVDSGRCKVLYDGNESEYEEYYDYSTAAAAGGAGGEEEGGAQPNGGELVLADAEGGAPAAALGAGGFELVLTGDGGGGGLSGGVKVLGSRDLAMYYRQRHRPADTRSSVAAGAVVAQYRALGVDTREGSGKAGGAEAVSARRSWANRNRLQLKCEMRNDKIFNLPKNCTH